jgi:hypothetical protein
MEERITLNTQGTQQTHTDKALRDRRLSAHRLENARCCHVVSSVMAPEHRRCLESAEFLPRLAFLFIPVIRMAAESQWLLSTCKLPIGAVMLSTCIPKRFPSVKVFQSTLPKFHGVCPNSSSGGTVLRTDKCIDGAREAGRGRTEPQCAN